MNDVKNKVNIVNVIQQYIHLQKKGNSWIGLCPFHHDTHPSLSVSEKLQLFKCFACETRGDVITFVQKINNISYGQAIELICKNFGIEIEQKNASKFQKANEINQKNIPLWDICDSIRRIYNDELLEAIKAKNLTVINFLNKRKLTVELIETFKLGFAPARSNFLTKSFLDPIEDEILRNQYDQILTELGYLNKETNDFFVNRIIFPILDENENVVGFSGRSLVESKTIPKYLNSHESTIFKKANVLFNFNHNKKKGVSKIFLVEGFMEVISLWKIGVTNAIATMGTSFSEQHINLLKKLNNLEEIVICFDQDNSGQLASISVARQLLKNKKWRISLLKSIPFKDLDEFIRNATTEEVLQCLQQPVNYFSWYTELLIKNLTISDKALWQNDIIKKVLLEIKQFANVPIPEVFVDNLATKLELKSEDIRLAYKRLCYRTTYF